MTRLRIARRWQCGTGIAKWPRYRFRLGPADPDWMVMCLRCIVHTLQNALLQIVWPIGHISRLFVILLLRGNRQRYREDSRHESVCPNETNTNRFGSDARVMKVVYWFHSTPRLYFVFFVSWFGFGWYALKIKEETHPRAIGRAESSIYTTHRINGQ